MALTSSNWQQACAPSLKLTRRFPGHTTPPSHSDPIEAVHVVDIWTFLMLFLFPHSARVIAAVFAVFRERDELWIKSGYELQHLVCFVFNCNRGFIEQTFFFKIRFLSAWWDFNESCRSLTICFVGLSSSSLDQGVVVGLLKHNSEMLSSGSQKTASPVK